MREPAAIVRGRFVEITDPWRGARALFAAGFRPGDVALNTFSYHLTRAVSFSTPRRGRWAVR